MCGLDLVTRKQKRTVDDSSSLLEIKDAGAVHTERKQRTGDGLCVYGRQVTTESRHEGRCRHRVPENVGINELRKMIQI